MTHHLYRFPSIAKIIATGIFASGIFALRVVTSSLVVTNLTSIPAFAQAADTSDKAEPSPITIEATEFLEWNQNEGTYIAKGNAYVQQDQASINAGHIIARYTNDDETREITRVIATGMVTYIEGENTAKGDKLNYDLAAKFYLLTGKKASVEGPRGLITATKSITYNAADDAKRKLTAIGKARYKNSDGRTVFGDKLIAYFGADGTLKIINAYDNTKVITVEGTIATADKLDYEASTSLANLNGNVKIIDKENIMQGARAKIDFDNKISKIISIPGGQRVSGTLSP